MTAKTLATAVAIAFHLASGPAAGADFTHRDAGPTESQMLANSDGGLPGLAFVRPVLDGVLYRAGFKGGDKARTGLSGAQRTALCEAGFSGARYVDFGTNTQFGKPSCGGKTFDYEKGTSSNAQDIMREIHSVIENPAKGPLLVHCMWGVHSSGAVSAMALMQFCDWPQSKATAYWHKARNNAPCGSGGCDKWIDGKLASFRVDPALKISAEQQRKICPQ